MSSSTLSLSSSDSSGFTERILPAGDVKLIYLTLPRSTGSTNYNARVKCYYCSKQFTGTVTRVVDHLLGRGSSVSTCTAVPTDLRDALRQHENNKSEAKANKVLKRKLSEIAVDMDDEKELGNKLKQLPISTSLEKATSKSVDSAVANWFYYCAIPFNTVENKYFQKMIKAIKEAPTGYVPPTRKSLSGTLLDEARSSIQTKLQTCKPNQSTWGYTLATDGWTDANRRPLVNYIQVLPGCAEFVEAKDASGIIKSAPNTAADIITRIEAMGADDCVQVKTDQPHVMKAAWKIVEAKFPHVFASGCVPHGLDLLLEDIGKLEWVRTIVQDTKEVLKFIGNHQYTLALFREKGHLELLRPGDTRFATVFLTIERMVVPTVQQALIETVTDNKYATWLEKQTGDTQSKGESVKALIVGSQLWKDLKVLCDIFEPIVVALRTTDSDVPTTGEVYYMMYRIQDKLEQVTITAAKRKEIIEMYMNRWNNTVHNPLLGAGYLLNPKYHELKGHAWTDEKNKRMEADFMEECLTDLTTCLQRYYNNERAKVAVALQQFATFKQGTKGCMGTCAVWEAAVITPAHEWWDTWCNNMPELQAFAKKILAQVQCASACERNWSSYGFVHSVRRNKLKPDRAASLVYVFTNLRLRDRLLTDVEMDKESTPTVDEWIESMAEDQDSTAQPDCYDD